MKITAVLTFLVVAGGCGVFDRPCNSANEALTPIVPGFFPDAIPPVLIEVTYYGADGQKVVAQGLGESICLPSDGRGGYDFRLTEFWGLGQTVEFTIID